MGTIILRTKNGITSSVPSYRKYTRPSEWLTMPSISTGEEVVYMLVKVYEQGDNYLAMRLEGDYEVNWGDGTVTTHSSGTLAENDIQWSGVSSSTLTSGGYRQAMVTVIPQSGSSLTRIEMDPTGGEISPDDPYTLNTNMVSVKMAGQNFTTLSSAFRNNYGIEEFEFVGTHNCTNLSQMFMYCYNLRKVIQFDTSNVTSFFRLHFNNSRLLEVPKYDISSATNVDNMFYFCFDIEYIQPWDLDNEAPSLTDIDRMFNGCKSLKNLPLTSMTNITSAGSTFFDNKFKKFDLNCPNLTIVTNMFQSCTELEEITSDFPSGLTNTGYMFNSCFKLKILKPFDTTSVTNSAFMFGATYDLKDVSGFNFSASTNSGYMFLNSGIEKPPMALGGGGCNYFAQGCFNVREWPEFHQPITAAFRMFQGNNLLEELPTMDVSSVTDIRTILQTSYNVRSLPAWNLSGVTTSDANTFQNCYELRESNISGLTRTHSYRRTQLNRDAIVNVFNNLGTASGSQTIYVNETPGAANLTAGDVAIATGKGWTVVV
jgi:hypothetical protein